MKRKKPGRPPSQGPNEQVATKILAALRGGAYIETASAFAGIHKDTLYDWLKRGAKEDSGAFRDFSDAVEKAMAEGELRHLQRIDDASKTEWQAAAWMLERKFPQRWGRQNKEEKEAQRTLLELQALLLQHKLEELRTKEALLDLLSQKAPRDVYLTVLQLLTGRTSGESPGSPRPGTAEKDA